MKFKVEETTTTSIHIDCKDRHFTSYATGQNGEIFSAGIKRNRESPYDHDVTLFFAKPDQLQEAIDLLTGLQKELERYEW